MKRLLIITIVLMLAGCISNKEAYCEKKENDHLTSISIKAENDRIYSIAIEESFKLPASLLQSEETYRTFLASIHDEYEIREGNLILKKVIYGDYSFSKTLEELSKNYFYCSCSVNR
ncbi:MAG: hypothetical protein PUD22_08985 [Erysipelotrichaceae bacterium]|nr:hypothetical protein [Erysipelotrichaceae bacterium]